MTAVECPDCGALIAKRGLASHQRGDLCTAGTQARAAREEGLERASGSWRVLRAAGLIEDRYTHFVRGGPGRRNKIDAENWAPAWAVRISKAAVGSDKFQDRVELLKRCAADPNERERQLALLELASC